MSSLFVGGLLLASFVANDPLALIVWHFDLLLEHNPPEVVRFTDGIDERNRLLTEAAWPQLHKERF
jgi:hypothetical protein